MYVYFLGWVGRRGDFNTFQPETRKHYWHPSVSMHCSLENRHEEGDLEQNGVDRCWEGVSTGMVSVGVRKRTVRRKGKGPETETEAERPERKREHTDWTSNGLI